MQRNRNMQCRLLVGFIVMTLGVMHAWPQAPSEVERQRVAREIELQRIAQQTGEMKARMEAEGFTRENNYMVGRCIMPADQAGGDALYPAEYFPHKWDFDDGTTCGITETNNMADVTVANGALRFTVVARDKNTSWADTNAYFSWGDFASGQAGLRIGYGRDVGQVAKLVGFRVRMRQSLPQSVWQVATRSLHNVGIRGSQETRDQLADLVTVTGTEWQIVTIVCLKDIMHTRGLEGPYTGFRLISQTPGNQVEIDWIKPYSYSTTSLYRKSLELSDDVRWAKCSIVALQGGQIKLYVNGKLAVSRWVGRNQLWNFDLDPALFHKGKNVIGYVPTTSGNGKFLLDGSLLCRDGNYQRFDSDESWMNLVPRKVIRIDDPKTETAWTLPEYSATNWSKASLAAVRDKVSSNAPPADNEWVPERQWFNPSWKGRLMVAPANGRSQPVFGSKEEVALKVAWPVSQQQAPEITWQVFDEMGDGFHAADKLVAEGKLELKNQKSEIRNQKCADYVGELKFPAGKLPANAAYAVVLKSMVEGKEVEKYRYEIAVCGPVPQPVVDNPTNYTDGMQLKLVYEINAPAEPKPGEFISVDGQCQPRESTVITTPLGKFRQPYALENIKTRGGGPANFISWKYRIEHPGKPHLAIADYPDDTERNQELRLTEGQWAQGRSFAGITELGNHTANLGIGNPLTQELRQHYVVFWPNEQEGAVSVFSLEHKNWTTNMAARIGKIKIYEILNDVPMRKIYDAPGAKKWIGQQPERGPNVMMQSCFSSPINTLFRNVLFATDTPNFYRNWMVTYLNMIKRLRFAGENSYFCGQYMYAETLFPSIYSDSGRQMKVAGSLRDYGVLMGRMFDENGMGFFTATELCWMSSLPQMCSDDDVARGMDTPAQVYKDGHQGFSDSFGLTPNYIHPQVRERLEALIDEWVALYAKEPGWKGMMMYLDTLNGPSWARDEDRQMDPYACSYDDYTIGQFEKDTGVKIPVDARDMKRFSKRYDWLMANAEAKAKWTEWRCRKMTETYAWIGARLQKERKDLQMILCAANDVIGLWGEPYIAKVKTAGDLLAFSRSAGLDQDAVRKLDSVVLALERSSNPDQESWFYARQDIMVAPFESDGRSGFNHRGNWREAQPSGLTNWVFEATGPESYWDFPAEYFADTWVNQFIRANPAIFPHGIQDLTMQMGHEYEMARFAAAFRSLPAAKYTKLKGQGRDINVWMAVAKFGEDAYGYVANRQCWELEADVTFAPGTKVTDLITGQPVAGTTWKIKLAPYKIQTFRAERADPLTVVASCVSRVGIKGQNYVRGVIQKARTSLDDQEKTAAVSSELEVRQLKELGLREAVERLVKESEALLAMNDFAGAYDVLTSSIEARRIAQELEPKARLIVYGYPTADEAYRAAGTALSKKEYAVARKNYRQAAKIGQGVLMVQAQLGVGDTYRAEKDYEKAKAEYLKVMTLPNANALHQGNAWNNIAGILQDEKNPVEAKQYQDKSRAAWLQAGDDTSLADRDRTEALYKVGVPMYTNDKQYAGARAVFNKILMLKTPDQGYLPNVQYYLGYCWFQEKNYVEARKAWQKDFGLRNMPPTQKVRLCLAIGDSYKAEGKNDEARAEYDKVAGIPGISAADKKSAELRLAELY